MMNTASWASRAGWPGLRAFPSRLASHVFILSLLCGCTAGAAPDGAPASHLAPPAAPLLGPGDELHVSVYGEDRLSGPVTVGHDGAVDIPLAGHVQVAGMTPQQAGQRIAARLRGSLLQPRVTATVSAWRPIYVSGEVERAGEYPWRPGLNLMSAVAMAGGATRRASHSEILVQRQGAGPLVAVPLSPETPVTPGDLLKLPERLF